MMDKSVIFPKLPDAMSQDPLPTQSSQDDRIAKGRKLVDIEERLRSRYLEIRSIRFPASKAVLTHKADAAWERMAEIVYELQADPVEWIEAQCNRPGILPSPGEMACNNAVQHFQNVCGKVSASPADLVHTHRFYVENLMIRTGASETEVFLDPNIDLRAWYRVLFAPEPILNHCVKRYKRVAIKQITSDEKLQQYLKTNHGDRIERIIPKSISAKFGGTHPPVSPPTEAALRSTSW